MSDDIELDEQRGYAVLDDFERFSAVDDVFARSWWDDEIRTPKAETFYATYRRPLTKWRKANGFTQRDYALRNASWHVSDVFTEMYEPQRRDGFLDPLSMLRDGPSEPLASESPEDAALEVKHVAKVFGADLVGVTAFDQRWVYTERFSAETGGAKPNELPEGLTSVIVIGQAMDSDLIRTAPSALSGTATGLGYSQDAAVLLGIAQYIKNLGYEAVPSMNDTALAIPLAIEAGLGEYARNGLVITPEHGAGCVSARYSRTCRSPTTRPGGSAFASSVSSATGVRQPARLVRSRTANPCRSHSTGQGSKA